MRLTNDINDDEIRIIRRKVEIKKRTLIINCSKRTFEREADKESESSTPASSFNCHGFYDQKFEDFEFKKSEADNLLVLPEEGEVFESKGLLLAPSSPASCSTEACPPAPCPGEAEAAPVGAQQPQKSRSRRPLMYICSALFGAAIIAGGIYAWHASKEPAATTAQTQPQIAAPLPTAERHSFAEISEIVTTHTKLKLLTPIDAVPTLVIGPDALAAPGIVLGAQVADVRGDNGEIAGSFVLDGNLISKGNNKAGFCAIINGTVTIGVDNASAMLERALDTGGCFFRQYPLVAGGQVVENKPKGRHLRKALAEIGGTIRVVIGTEPQTFGEFSQSLVEAGATTAIYLIGSDAPWTYTTAEGQSLHFGHQPTNEYPNINFIVWK